MDRWCHMRESQSNFPTTAMGYLLYLIKTAILAIPRRLKKLVIRMGIVFVLLFFFNLWLTIGPNGGFALSKGNPLWPMTMARANQMTASLFWAVLMFFLSISFTRMRRDGIELYFLEVITSPVQIISDFKEGNVSDSATFLITIAIFLGITLMFTNPYLIIICFLIAFLSFTLRQRSVLITLFAFSVNDLNRLLKRENKMTEHGYSLMVLGLAVAFLIVWILPDFWYLRVITMLVLLILSILLLKNKITPDTASMIVVWLLIAATAERMITTYVWADDGGWAEAGGTLPRWIASNGADEAATMASGAAGAGSAGAGLGGVLGGGPDGDDSYNDSNVENSDDGKGSVSAGDDKDQISNEKEHNNTSESEHNNNEFDQADGKGEESGSKDQGTRDDSESGTDSDSEPSDISDVNSHQNGSSDDGGEEESSIGDEKTIDAQKASEDADSKSFTGGGIVFVDSEDDGLIAEEVIHIAQGGTGENGTDETEAVEVKSDVGFAGDQLGEEEVITSSDAQKASEDAGSKSATGGGIVFNEANDDGLVAEEMTHTIQGGTRGNGSDVTKAVEVNSEDSFANDKLGEEEGITSSNAQKASEDTASKSFTGGGVVFNEAKDDGLVAEEATHTIQVDTSKPGSDEGVHIEAEAESTGDSK